MELVLNAVREAGYRYESGNLLPLETRKEDTMENQKNTLEVSVKVYPLQEKGGNLLAFASATVGGCFAVNGIRVMDSEKGKFVPFSARYPDGFLNVPLCLPISVHLVPDARQLLLQHFAALRAGKVFLPLSGIPPGQPY